MFAHDLHLVAWWLWGWETARCHFRSCCPQDSHEPLIVDTYRRRFGLHPKAVEQVRKQLPESGCGHPNALFRRGVEWALRRAQEVTP